jgi:large subunit ribosomal protein L15
MELHNLKPAKGSIKSRKRAVGRGEGSKKGGTSTRGHKGAKSRSGYSKKIGFEGGQQPLQRRVPKFGFTSPNRVEYNGVNIDTIQALVESKKLKETIVNNDLIDNGLVQKKDLVKILGRGELSVKLNITANAFSASAKEAIEKAGGKATIIEK